MRDGIQGFTVLHVRHASRVAAVSSAEGPRLLLEAGFAEELARGGLPVRVETLDLPPGEKPGEVGASFRVCDLLSGPVRAAGQEGRLAVVLSGSCHAAVGAVAGLPPGPCGVVWCDAHADFNTTETTASGLLDGTTLATLTGRAWKTLREGVSGFRVVPDHRVVLIGARDLDQGEAKLLDASSIRRVPTEGLRARGRREIRRLAGEVEGVYLHLDLDVLDPSIGRANRFAPPGGASLEQLETIVEEVVARSPVRAVAFTSYDPAADPSRGVQQAALSLARVLSRAAA